MIPAGDVLWHDEAMVLHLTGDPSADALLSEDPLALLIGMLLDQQVSMETAFAGPAKIRDRIGSLDPAVLAGQDPEAFAAAFAVTPAVHRFPAAMAARTQRLCGQIVEQWGGDAAALWTRDSPDGAEVVRRLGALPGFGPQKARIFLALLGKQCGVRPAGWRQASAPYGEPGSFRSVADVTDSQSLLRVRESKRAAKAAARAAS